MKGLLIVIIVLGVAGICLGFYEGWLLVDSENTGGKSHVTLSVDKDKFQQDKKAAVAEVQGAGRDVKGRLGGTTEQTASAPSHHDGKVVSITGTKLVMTNLRGEEEGAYTLTPDLKITCDGKNCQATDLKAGMKVRVTVEKTAPHTATRIEALDSYRQFDKGV